jgi:hypothetical protein
MINNVILITILNKKDKTKCNFLAAVAAAATGDGDDEEEETTIMTTSKMKNYQKQ